MGKFVKGLDLGKFNSLMWKSIFSALITCAIGLCIMFMPDLTNAVIGYIIGGTVLLNGITSLYKFFIRDGAKLYSFNLMFGILSLILGIVIIVVPHSVTEFLTVCLGLFLIIMGSNKITYGVWLKIGADKSWFITLVIGLFLIIFGISLMFNPYSALTLTKLVGTFVLVEGLLDLTNTVLIKRRGQEIIKIFW